MTNIVRLLRAIAPNDLRCQHGEPTSIMSDRPPLHPSNGLRTPKPSRLSTWVHYAVGVMLEAIALHTWPSSFLRRAGSIVQRHNTNIKYNFSSTYTPKAKRKISGSLLPIYPWEGCCADYSLPIYLVGVIRRQVICLSALYGNIGRLDLSNKLLAF